MNKKLLAMTGVALMLTVSACGDDNDSDNDVDLPTVPTGVEMPTDSTMVTDTTMMTEATG